MTEQDSPLGPLPEPVDFGPYTLLERIGSSGRVDVYLAKTSGIEGFERSISLRCLRDSADASEEVVSEFVEQAKRASLLQHANIAQVLDLGKADGTYYVAAQYVAGPTLNRLTETVGGALPAPIAVHIATKVLEALEYAHNRTDEAGHAIELLHTGIAPGDVAVSSDGQVKLLSFGVASMGRSGPSTPGVSSDRLGYMSPEQVRGLPLDRRSDTFAVGVILHEMLTGRRLFDGDSEFEILEKIRKVEVTPPSLINPNIPSALEDHVLKALARGPQTRFQTANHMARELQKWSIGADAFLSDGDIRIFVSDAMPELETLEAPEPIEELEADEELPFEPGLEWDDEEIETALFAKHEGVIPRKGDAPDPDQELGEWSRDHSTGLHRRPESGTSAVPMPVNADLGSLPEPPVASGEIPAIGILASPDANTGFEPTVEEILRDESGAQAVVTTGASNSRVAAIPKRISGSGVVLAPTSAARVAASTPPQPSREGGLGWLIGVAALVVIGLAVFLVRSGGGDSPALQLALTPVDLEYTVLVDGDIVHEGLVPTSISDLATGSHQVTVRADGYRERTEMVMLGPNDALVNWEILPVPIVVVPFNSEPPGATLMVDGENRGKTPLEVELVVGALVNVEMQLDGHDSHATSFIVTERSSGVTVALAELAPPVMTTVPIISSPEGTVFTVRGADGAVAARGSTPGEATLEVGGTYSVTLTHDGFVETNAPLVVNETGFDTFTANLLEQPAEPEPEESGDIAAVNVAERGVEPSTEVGPSDSEEEPPAVQEPETQQPQPRLETEPEPEQEPEPLEPEFEPQREEPESEPEPQRVEPEPQRVEPEPEPQRVEPEPIAEESDRQREERESARREREDRLRAEAEARDAEAAAAVAAVAEPAAVEPGPPGYINVQSAPPARIIIDGTDTGLDTPTNGIPLSSGVRHRVELVNEAVGLHRTYRISLDPGQVRNIVNRSN
ncbi:MAG: serine/threonine protein kinase [Bradymonadia bacterium]|jgi:serine/threonine protein kinase